MSSTRKLCVVAGVGPGMGRAIARAFGAQGYDLAIMARTQATVGGIARELTALGMSATPYCADLSDADSLRRTFAQIAADLGDPEVLVYNGGAWHEGPAMQVRIDDFDRDLRLCVTGALVAAQLVYPAMRKAGRGTILMTGGGLALAPQRGVGVASLTAGKSGLRGLAHVLAAELRPDNIHVATVTIAGIVAAGTALDPDTIARTYVELHCQAPTDWEVERVFDGR